MRQSMIFGTAGILQAGWMCLVTICGSLGADIIVQARQELAEVIKRPLESERWAGCIDNVGGEMLARILGQLKYGCSVAAIGNAGGLQMPASVIPFLRGASIFWGLIRLTSPMTTEFRLG